MRWLGAFRRREGQSVVEFALAVPIFLLLVMGILEFSMVMWYRNVVAEAAREGTRYAIVHGAKSAAPADAVAVEGVVRAYAFGTDPANLTVASTWPSGDWPGSEVRVTVTYVHTPFTRIILGGATFTLASTSVAHIVY